MQSMAKWGRDASTSSHLGTGIGGIRLWTGEADLRKPLWTIAMFLLWQKRWGEG